METMYLQGNEEVQRAARSIASSAEETRRAASQFDTSVERFATLVLRLEEALIQHASKMELLTPEG